nr:hypothetical protein [Nocardia aobensis]
MSFTSTEKYCDIDGARCIRVHCCREQSAQPGSQPDVYDNWLWWIQRKQALDVPCGGGEVNEGSARFCGELSHAKIFSAGSVHDNICIGHRPAIGVQARLGQIYDMVRSLGIATCNENCIAAALQIADQWRADGAVPAQDKNSHRRTASALRQACGRGGCRRNPFIPLDVWGMHGSL